MANSIICVICLRTDIIPVEIPKAHSEFFVDFTHFRLAQRYTTKRYKFCTVCAHLLKKAYNFKLRCIRSCQLLKSVNIAKNKHFPSDLHSQNPTSLGFCSILAPYKLLEHKYVEDTDLLDTKDNISLIDPIALSMCNEVESANVTDPTLHDHIYIKSELDTGEPDGETVQNLTIATTSKENLTLNNDNFENYVKNFNLIPDRSDNTEACVTENVKPSKINDFLRSFGEEITNFDEDNDLNDKITQVASNDPFKDEESLNSMDDITSDSDTGSLSMEDMKSDDDSDSADSKFEDSDSDKEFDEFLKKIKTTTIKPIKISKIQDLELVKALLKVDKKNKSLKTQVVHLMRKTKVLNEITGMFVEGRFDLGDGLVMNKEDFHKMVESWTRSGRVLPATVFVRGVLNKQKAKEFLSQLMKRYNPDYGTIFNIEYMDTAEEKQQEFDRRKDSEAYKNAPLKCTLCYKAFPSAPILEKHNKRHDPIEGGVACQICSLWFKDNVKRCSHNWKAHSARYSCKLCPAVTLYCFDSMIRHYQQHKGAQYKCSDCHGVFNHYSTLMNHRRVHWTRHACSSCGQAHANETALRLHRDREHKDLAPVDPADTVTCPDCGLVCDSQAVYKRHARISHKPYRFRCWCWATFETAAELRGHRRDSGHERVLRHWPVTRPGAAPPRAKGPRTKGPRPRLATCPICDAEVAHMPSRSLDRHYLLLHPGEPLPHGYEPKEPYRHLCDECGKSYLSAALLRDHKNTHTGARPYACPTKDCGRRYSSLAQLRFHAERHAPPRYDCPHCGKLFKSASNRRCHVRSHVQDRRYKCGACGKGFIHAASLTEHIRHVHNKERRIRKRIKKQEEEEM